MIEDAIKDVKETAFDVLRALVANSYQVSETGTFPVVEYEVTTQAHGKVKVTTVVERLDHFLYISFITARGTNRFSIAVDGSVEQTFTKGPDGGIYLLDAVDEMRVLFNAVIIMKARARKDQKDLIPRPTAAEIIQHTSDVAPEGSAGYLERYLEDETKIHEPVRP